MKTITKKILVIIMAAVIVASGSGAASIKAASLAKEFTIYEGNVTVGIAPDFDYYNCCWHFRADKSDFYYLINDSDAVSKIEVEFTGSGCNFCATVQVFDNEETVVSTARISGFKILPGQTYLGNAGDIIWSVSEQ